MQEDNKAKELCTVADLVKLNEQSFTSYEEFVRTLDEIHNYIEENTELAKQRDTLQETVDKYSREISRLGIENLSLAKKVKRLEEHIEGTLQILKEVAMLQKAFKLGVESTAETYHNEVLNALHRTDYAFLALENEKIYNIIKNYNK